MLRSWPLGLYLLAFAFMHISRWVNQMNWIPNFGVIIVLLTTLNMIFSVTYCSELYVPISFYYECTFLPSKGVNVF